MKSLLRIVVLTIVAPAMMAAENPFSDYNRYVYRFMKLVLVASAEKMPEEDYAFKPAESVRTFGELVGHVAESQYFFCSTALGEKNPEIKAEKVKTSKADLVAALKDAVKYCDRAYDGMTDEAGSEKVKMMRRETPKLAVLSTNAIHSAEHYGNMITYLRIKGIVPPSSDTDVLKQLQ
jgi:uncharacterized damage-inducible protein DinB